MEKKYGWICPLCGKALSPDTIVFTSVNQVTLTFFESVSGYAKVKG